MEHENKEQHTHFFHQSACLANIGISKTSGGSKQNISATDDDDDNNNSGWDDEALEVEKRLRTLQRLVPGGEGVEVDRLFELTASYIEALRGQVGVMAALVGYLEGDDSASSC